MPKDNLTPLDVAGQWRRPNLPLYLPGNGGLLLAIGMMAGGWEGAPAEAPGFPTQKWPVRAEGLRPWI